MKSRSIKIKTTGVEISAELNDSKIADSLWKCLPLEASANTWGEEIYFPIPVKERIQSPVEVVKEGDIGYWPDGHAFCVFFGPTPISSPGEIRPASAVEIIGKVTGDLSSLSEISSGETIVIEKEES